MLHAAPLPTNQWIWDVHSLPGDPNTIVVAFSGFGLAQHVWRGVVPAAGAATWTAVSNGLPDVPMYSLALDTATRWFVGTDIGVFRSADAGATWTNYSQGLPNTAIYDLRLRAGGTLLRAATHGRGLWEVRTDVTVHPTVDVFVRDHIMNTGRPPSNAPEPAAWEDPTRYVALNDTCYWWHCADIKTDAPPNWQLQPNERNYFNFETKLTHENPEKGNQNRVYVQVHNRGPLAADNVTVKIMTAGASAGLPALPADFWTTWPNSAGDANWTPVGTPQTITRVDPLRPEVLQWDWTPAASADTHSCMLVVVDTPSDPIPASTKAIFDIGQLVTTEKRVGLKNLHVVNVLPDSITPVPFHLFGSRAVRGPYVLRVPALQNRRVTASWLLSKTMSRRLGTRLPTGVRAKRFAAADLERLKRFWLERELRGDSSWRDFVDTYDTSQLFSLEARRGGVDLPVTIREGSRESMVLLFGGEAGGTEPLASLTLLQVGARNTIVGGSTFIFKSVNR
jgi:hypothetical protein